MIDGDLNHGVGEPQSTVGPCTVKVNDVSMAERPDDTDNGVEKRWLLPEMIVVISDTLHVAGNCLLYTSPSPRD